MRLIWMICGLVSLSVGIAGIILPLVPTVPLFLLATFCFARSSERLHYWLLNHPRFGPPIHEWHSRGAISKRAKRLATLSIALTFGLSLALGLKDFVILIQAITLCAVLVFIWSRPSA